MNPKITYAPEWIAKILSGQKTMTIRRTQYPCGVHDVVSEAEPDRVVCQIEIVKVEKVNFKPYHTQDPKTHEISEWFWVSENDIFKLGFTN